MMNFPLRALKHWGWLRHLASVTALGLMLGACGGSTSTSSSPTSSEASPASSPSGGEPFTVGLVLVGPKNDGGWSQAHYEGLEYVTKKLPNVKIEYVDKVNPGDRPNVKGSQVADDLITKGAKLVIFNSDDLKDDALELSLIHI
jgi:simple sugar transport system substrate-binding protein